jgi:hypothetical protein
MYVYKHIYIFICIYILQCGLLFVAKKLSALSTTAIWKLIHEFICLSTYALHLPMCISDEIEPFKTPIYVYICIYIDINLCRYILHKNTYIYIYIHMLIHRSYICVFHTKWSTSKFHTQCHPETPSTRYKYMYIHTNRYPYMQEYIYIHLYICVYIYSYTHKYM